MCAFFLCGKKEPFQRKITNTNLHATFASFFSDNLESLLQFSGFMKLFHVRIQLHLNLKITLELFMKNVFQKILFPAKGVPLWKY